MDQFCSGDWSHLVAYSARHDRDVAQNKTAALTLNVNLGEKRDRGASPIATFIQKKGVVLFEVQTRRKLKPHCNVHSKEGRGAV